MAALENVLIQDVILTYKSVKIDLHSNVKCFKNKTICNKKKKNELGRYNNCYNIEKSNGNYNANIKLKIK